MKSESLNKEEYMESITFLITESPISWTVEYKHKENNVY